MQRTHLAILLSKGRTWPGVCLRKTALTAVRGGVQRRQTLEVEAEARVKGLAGPGRAGQASQPRARSVLAAPPLVMKCCKACQLTLGPAWLQK